MTDFICYARWKEDLRFWWKQGGTRGYYTRMVGSCWICHLVFHCMSLQVGNLQKSRRYFWMSILVLVRKFSAKLPLTRWRYACLAQHFHCISWQFLIFCIFYGYLIPGTEASGWQIWFLVWRKSRYLVTDRLWIFIFSKALYSHILV